ncbi:MAG: methylaspartate mutase accessory protein GlmL [Prevotella sp.]|uniref:methylaspartate mutase accessory protein GlmL n=1 Tax=Prevotella sp. TaxID=59823 RepID=UPI002A2CC76F|nr:methylaspartate mutase accessory protein GlmL [Prevotella sp.]MDD7317321.1 methylaspartate mutase accessory protein GlmL [Prevotellaceae bacterium]MDY4019925.1 methylaspartate mutase accessory protein GlmL [Prevotella sp.]
MNYLTVDFGSTYTKVTAIDSALEKVVGTASAFTTIDTDVMEGLKNALQRLEETIGEFKYDKLLCCSSAAGGLKMVALGLVPELTAKAAKMAASSAGAKVVKTYSFEISQAEQQEIHDINPDLVLLCGGTDGGNKDVIIANAKRLCEVKRNFAIIAAGNKSASYELAEIFKSYGRECVITENVMPQFNKINILPAKQKIKELFISRIIDAKGLSKVQEMCENQIVPTPLAVLTGCELLSKGHGMDAGIGDLMAVDLGGATTDVYSMSDGTPTIENVLVKGLPEPYSKRSVEGDLGMRYSLTSLADELNMEVFAHEIGVEQKKVEEWIARCSSQPSTLPSCAEEAKIEQGLARNAVRIAVERHCGYFEPAYTPLGQIFTLTGKDLTQVPYVVGIGGSIKNSDNPECILKGAESTASADMMYAKPKNPKYMLDSKYIFASMGLLSTVEPKLALKILKEEIKLI